MPSAHTLVGSFVVVAVRPAVFSCTLHRVPQGWQERTGEGKKKKEVCQGELESLQESLLLSVKLQLRERVWEMLSEIDKGTRGLEWHGYCLCPGEAGMVILSSAILTGMLRKNTNLTQGIMDENYLIWYLLSSLKPVQRQCTSFTIL